MYVYARMVVRFYFRVHYFSKIYLEYNTDILLGESTAHTVQNNMFIFYSIII